jgi:AraC family transcriptional regulator of adaptative response/methylated-DNA-[protein]-cysteine methyltransferase
VDALCHTHRAPLVAAYFQMVGLGRTLSPHAKPPRSARAQATARAADDAHSWAAVLARDSGATFVYAVASTGIYCRPSCPSRRPLRKNVAFFATAQAAELSGYRACKRCSPGEVTEGTKEEREQVTRMCHVLERSEPAPSLAELAGRIGLSPHQAHRRFVKALGLTPKQYRGAIERQRVESALGRSASVTAALHGAGIGSAARFYERVAPRFGMQPAEAKRGGRGISIRYAMGSSKLGLVLVAATERGVCAVALGDARQELLRGLEQRFPSAEIQRGEDLDDRLESVIELVEGRSTSAKELPLDIRGTAFQERVWRQLREIPRGTTQTYSELARAVGAETAVRAVAHACARNPLAVLVPCHRIVRKGGELAGYRWGIERKRTLLEQERAVRSLARGPAVKEGRGRAARRR